MNDFRKDSYFDPPDAPEWTMAELSRIQRRTDELMAERLADRERFNDLMSGIDADEINPHLQRAILNLDRSCQGDKISTNAVLSAVNWIQHRIKQEAEVWRDECEALAERELQGD